MQKYVNYRTPPHSTALHRTPPHSTAHHRQHISGNNLLSLYTVVLARKQRALYDLKGYFQVIFKQQYLGAKHLQELFSVKRLQPKMNSVFRRIINSAWCHSLPVVLSKLRFSIDTMLSTKRNSSFYLEIQLFFQSIGNIQFNGLIIIYNNNLFI